MNSYADALLHSGMSAPAAELKGLAFEHLRSAAKHLGFGEPLHAFFIPGRIEVLGKHTDYAGGRSLLCCPERGFCVLAAPRNDCIVRFVDLASKDVAQWPFTSEQFDLPVHWATYPATVSRRIAKNFPATKTGVDVIFRSDLPRAAGMSSSSALVTASFFAVAAANHLQDACEFQQNFDTRENLATYLACIENGSSFGPLTGDRGVGTFGGSEDHTAILLCEPGKLSGFSFCPLQFEGSVKVPDDFTFVIAVSGVSADKTGDAQEKYNRLSLAASSILKLWNQASGGQHDSLRSAVAGSPDVADRIRRLLSASDTGNFLRSRFEQFLSETYEIVPQATVAFAKGDWTLFGELVDLSQRYSEKLLENQVAETSFLARAARDLGATAASACGAGFGGSVWALVNKSESANFIERWEARYRQQFPTRGFRSTFFRTAPGPSMQRLTSTT
jgi:galactokinase